MKTIFCKSRFPQVLTFILVFVLLSFLVPAPARADVGPQPLLPGGSNLKPGENTPIQMAAEVVTMNVRPATAADNAMVKLNAEWYGYNAGSIWFPGVAEVIADFTMKNPTNSPVSLDVWFPLASVLKTYGWNEVMPEEGVPRIENFNVSVDGVQLVYEISELPNPNGADKPLLPWASFPVTFPENKETRIQVRYNLPLQSLVKSRDLVLYYIFQTGAGWAGPIGQAELVLNLPYPASEETLGGVPAGGLNPPYYVYTGDVVASIPAGAVLEGSQARWTWKNLEPGPKDDFAILLMRPEIWRDLQAQRAAVKAGPGNGQAWLALCNTYHVLSLRSFRASIPSAYSKTYQPLVEPACREAARLLPGDAGPHYLLAWYYMPPLRQNPSLTNLQPVWTELKIGQELEALQPASQVYLVDCDPWGELTNAECIEAGMVDACPRQPRPEWSASVAEYVARDAEMVSQLATATAATAQRAIAAQQTQAHARSATPLPTLTYTLVPSPSPTVLPTATETAPPPPQPTAVPSWTPTMLASALPDSNPQPAWVIPAAAGAVGLIILGYLLLRRKSK